MSRLARVGTKYPLIEAAYAPTTLKRYKTAVAAFLKWCDATDTHPSGAVEMDEALTEYFHELYESGGSKVSATCALFGLLMFIPHYKTSLPMTRLTLRGWNKRHPPQPYPPLTWDLTVVIATRLLTQGHRLPALGVLLAFDCYLRLGELLGLRKEDVACPRDPRMGSTFTDTALRFRHTKTGPNQWVTVSDPNVATLLRQLVDDTPRHGFLFPVSAATFRRAFKNACSDLGLSPLYVPHSLRHGAATRGHLRGVPLEDILMRGRWASTKSARRYVQAGRALLLATHVPPRIARLGDILSSDILLIFSLPQVH
jgi:integrase